MEGASTLRSNSRTGDPVKYDRWLVAILVAAFVFYVPFISRQFSGDDWLWLSYAKKALTSPLIFLQRPMYGYFRPLNMVLVSLQRLIFGNHAIPFSVVSILLHCANIWLLWKVLARLKVPRVTQLAAAAFFAFYFLNASAIEWISVAHDLWVTGLCLLVVLRSLDASEKPSWSLFAQIWLLSMAAALIKESGFVATGLFWAVLLLKGISPLDRRFRLFSLLSGLSYVVFLVVYATTRTVADPEITIGVHTFINLWYFLVYLITPFAKRVVESVPEQLVDVLIAVRIAATILVPLCGVYLWRKGGVACRLFLLWSAAFVATIAIMNWGIGLFDLYSERTASRFMYSPVVGVSVCFAWLVHKVSERFRMLRRKYVGVSAVTLFALVSWLLVWQVSELYLENQTIADNIAETFRSSARSLAACDSVVVCSDDLVNCPSLVASSWHLEAMLYVCLDRNLTVTVVDKGPQCEATSGVRPNIAVFGWDNATRSLILLSKRASPADKST